MSKNVNQEGAWTFARVASRDGGVSSLLVTACRAGQKWEFRVKSMPNGLSVIPTRPDLYQADDQQYLQDAAEAVFNYCMKNNLR